MIVNFNIFLKKRESLIFLNIIMYLELTYFVYNALLSPMSSYNDENAKYLIVTSHYPKIAEFNFCTNVYIHKHCFIN